MKRWLPYLPLIFGGVSLFFIFNGLDFVNLGDIVREGKFRYLFLALVPIAFFSLRDTLTWPIAAFAAVALANWTLNNYFLLGAFPLILIFAVLLFANYITHFDKDLFALVLMVSGVIQGSLAVWQALGMEWYAVGLMGHETLLGPFLVAAIAPALWGKHWKSAAVMAAAILCTKSSMSYASFAALLSVFLWHRFSLQVAVTIVGVTLFGLGTGYLMHADSEWYSPTGRQFMWGFGWDAFKKAPLFGSGIGSWVGVHLPNYAAQILTEFRTHVPFQLHNDYLDFAVEYGVLPGIPLLAGIVQWLRFFKPTWMHAVCLAFLVNAGANFLLCISSLALIFVVCWVYSWKDSVPQGGGVSCR